MTSIFIFSLCAFGTALDERVTCSLQLIMSTVRVLSASCEVQADQDEDDVDVGPEADVEDTSGVDDVVSALRRRPVSRSSSTTKRSRADLVTHHDFQPALVTADDGLCHAWSFCVFYGFCQLEKLLFLLCGAMLARYMLSLCVRLFVHPSTTSGYCAKTAEYRIMQTTPHDSAGTLVFWCKR